MRAAALALGVLAIVCALVFARPHATPGPALRDFESYYAAGQTWAARRNPYSVDIWRFEQRIPGVEKSRGELLPFVGPPAFLPFWALLARMPYAPAAALWACLLLVAAAAVALVTLRFAGVFSAGALLSTTVLVIAFGPFTSDFALGQAALVAFAASVAATMCVKRSAAASVAATLVSAVQPNVAAVLLSQASSGAARRVLGIAFVIFAASGVTFLGWKSARSYLSGLAAHGSAERFAEIQITPAAVAYGFGVPAFFAQIIGIAFAIAAICACASLVRRTEIKPLWKLAAGCALLPFIVPFFHEHDFVVLLLPAVLCATLAENGAWTTAATGIVLAAVDWLGIAQRPDGLLQSLLLAAAALCALYALGENAARRLVAPAAVLAVLVVAGILARHDPAPIWPDAMRGAASLSGSAAGIWHGELVRTGQLAVNPFWALLRLLTLAGAALLSWATLATAGRRDQLEMS